MPVLPSPSPFLELPRTLPYFAAHPYIHYACAHVCRELKARTFGHNRDQEVDEQQGHEKGVQATARVARV